jgi:phosphoglycerol transferase MdoB-like AlkP superfamily enzyme
LSHKGTTFKILGFWRTLLTRRDWVYVLSLLVPFVVYNLALKALILSSRNVDTAGQFNVSTFSFLAYGMWSDLFFVMGYALLWIGLFAAVRKGPLRWVVLVLFHATTILVVLVKTIAYQYIQETGTTLDYTIMRLWLPRVDEIGLMLGQGIPPSAWVLLVAALSYAALGPLFVTRLVARWRGWETGSPPTSWPGKVHFFSALVLCLLALVLGSLSLREGFNPYDKYLLLTGQDSERITQLNKPLVRDPLANVAVTAFEELQRGESQDAASYPAVTDAPPASLVSTEAEQQRNVVVIFLESTRAQSVTPYNEDLENTPFMNELAKNSLLAERAYVSVPYSSKANVATNCGIFPHPVQVSYGLAPEANPGGIPARCLPDLLKDQGYNTAYFYPGPKDFEDFGALVNNFGYDQLYSRESMDEEDFQRMYELGLSGKSEDEVVLEPSEEWLTQQKESGNPFLATYFTAATHYPYMLPDGYEEEKYVEDEDLNRYLNAIRLQDTFLQDLFDQYEDLGLYDDTVFVILGDHGEAFGEHGLYTHGNTPHEEALKIPMLVHDPKRFQNGARVEEPVSQLDVLPTIVDLLGYEIDGGAYQGSSFLEPPPEDRPLYFSCWGAESCLASLEGTEKYIYYYDNQPDQLFDLSKDPLEQENLASERQEDVEKRRSELLAWRSKVDAIYRGPQSE